MGNYFVTFPMSQAQMSRDSVHIPESQAVDPNERANIRHQAFFEPSDIFKNCIVTWLAVPRQWVTVVISD